MAQKRSYSFEEIGERRAGEGEGSKYVVNVADFQTSRKALFVSTNWLVRSKRAFREILTYSLRFASSSGVRSAIVVDVGGNRCFCQTYLG